MVKRKSKKPNKFQKRNYDAMKRHNARSKRSRAIDESKTSKNTYNVAPNSWFKNPASSDVRNIDTKKIRAKSITEVIGFLKGTNRFNKKEFDKKIGINTRALTHLTKNERKALMSIARVRFSNVSLQKRKAKNTPNQYYVKIKK